MKSTKYKISVPGSLMLMGEHAVLHNKTALVCAVDQRMQVTLTPHENDEITISAKNFGVHQTNRHALQIVKPFQFVLQALTNYQQQLPSGFNLTIESDFSATLGLGSSAAVTVATIAVLMQWLCKSPATLDEIFQQSLYVIRQIQGKASGADVAASVWGGTLVYRNSSVVTVCRHHPPLVVSYSGYKTPTVEVIKRVSQLQAKQPTLTTAIFNLMDQCSMAAANAIDQANWQQLGEIANMAQGLMAALGVNDAKLQQLIEWLCQYPTIYGAKISGAGLGDCVIGIGHLPSNHSLETLEVSITTEGLKYESK